MTLDVTFSESDHDFPVGFSGSNLMVGADGATFFPVVSDNGVLSWTNDRGLDNPAPVNIKGKDGEDGASVTVKSISESTADGGSNVVTFSDGKKVTIKNGNKGKPGADGYTPIKNKDYFTEADKAEMIQAVISALPKYDGEVVAV